MKKSLNKRPWRVISGGQTGVDRAGLVAAGMEAKHAKEELKRFTISSDEEKDQNTKMKGKGQWQEKMRK